MTERSTLDPFEQRIASGLGRYVAPAIDTTPATEIARVAMRPRGAVVRVRNASRPRRFLLLGLAAALLLPAAYVGAITLRRAPDPTQVPPFDYVSIFVRRDEGSAPGVSIFAARPDGAEVLVRKVPDSIAGRLAGWGTVSESGWLALAVETRPWPMILVDLRREDAAPWVISEASTGGIGPRWGPTGLIAADAGGNGSRVVIVDPEVHTTRIVPMPGGLVGGGPSIVWSADGSGIVGSTGGEKYQLVPIDGSDPRPVVGEIFDPGTGWGRAMATVRICSPDTHCPGGADGRVQRVEVDGSTRTIWQQQGNDRALTAAFGRDVDEYWLAVDHSSGRQIAVVHIESGTTETVGTINRDSDWQYVDAPRGTPDRSMAMLWIAIGAEPAAVLVPSGGLPATFHTGSFAGFVASAASPSFAAGPYMASTESMPTAGAAYALPSVEDLMAAELRLNPGRRVLGKHARDAVEGDGDTRTFEITRDVPGAGEAYLDCFGPSSVTVTSGSHSTTNPCLGAGSYGAPIDASGPVTVTASGDVSWRLVIYSP